MPLIVILIFWLQNVRSPRGEPTEEHSTRPLVSARGARPPSASVGSHGGDMSPRRTRSDNALKFNPGDVRINVLTIMNTR